MYYEMYMTEPDLFWKIPSSKNDQKWLKMGQKWSFGRFRKIYLLVLSGNGVKWKNFKKSEKSGSKIMAKDALSQSDFIIL